MTPTPMQAAALSASPNRSAPPGAGSRTDGWVAAWTLAEVRWASAATLLFAVGVLIQLLGGPPGVWWAMYLACYACGGWEPGLAGLQALRERTLDVDLLMVVAAVLAACIGQVFDGALLIVIFATSGALEAFATKRTGDSVRALMGLAPQRAARVGADGAEEEVDVAALAVGDLVLVRPGERIGADGRVVDGLSEVGQASITGEPLPVTKEPDDEVYAGTLNGGGALTVRVTRGAGETVVARIVTMVAEASATKATTQLFIEKVEQRYSVGVVTATLALFAIPLIAGADFQPTLLRAMTFMIVASPCAVVLATMPPLLATIANAGRHGVLVKSAVALEELGKVDQLVLDKTGTLTRGTPRVSAVVALTGLSDPEVLRLAGGAERRSEHPVAAAVVAAASESGVTLPEVTDFTSTAGRGVAATVEGRSVAVGSPALLKDLPSTPASGRAEAAIRTLQDQGHTVVVLVIDDQPAAVIALTDQLRDGAAAAVAALAGVTGPSPVLLTGDNLHAARRLAEEVGITRIAADLLPEHKVDAVAALKAEPDGSTTRRRVMLVGDGVNDAPAMAAADIGVAMGRGGSDLAVQTADVILVRDDLAALAATITLARRAHRVVKANLVIAGTVITALVIWDILGTLPLPLGVAGHEGSTILVALNGLRLLRRGAWH